MAKHIWVIISRHYLKLAQNPIHSISFNLQNYLNLMDIHATKNGFEKKRKRRREIVEKTIILVISVELDDRKTIVAQQRQTKAYNIVASVPDQAV